MLQSVDIRLSFKILVLLFLCAALVPSTESKPKTEVGSEDARSESSKVSLSNAVSSESPEDYSSETESQPPSSKKPSKSKTKTKGKNNKKKTGKDKKNKKHSTERSSKKPEMSSTEPTKDMWKSSEQSESTSMKNTWKASNTEHTEDMWKSSEKPESSSLKSTWKASSTEPTSDMWNSSEQSESSSMKSTRDSSSTESCTDKMSESSQPEMDGHSEKTSTEPCTENMSESSKKSEKPGITEDSSMCGCPENMSEDEKTEEPCMEGMNPGSNCEEMMKGPIAPVFTPVGMDGEIDYSVIPEYIQYLYDNKVAGILVGGTTGEALTMSPSTRKTLLEHWLKAASKYDIKVMAQVGGADMPNVLDMAKHAQETGACGLLVLPQLFYKPRSTEDLVIYLKAVADQAPNIFLIYYDFPMMTGVTVNTTELFDMATKSIPSFKGMKSDLKAIFEAGPLLQDGQQIYLGNQQFAPAVLMGQESSIATVNNMFVDQVYEIIEAVHNGDVPKARRLQIKLNKIVNEITDVGDFQGAMKAAFEITTGITIGPLRKPQRPLGNEKRNRIRVVLKSNGVEIRGN